LTITTQYDITNHTGSELTSCRACDSVADHQTTRHLVAGYTKPCHVASSLAQRRTEYCCWTL